MKSNNQKRINDHSQVFFQFFLKKKMNKIEKYNMHGSLLCNAYGCRKHTKLHLVEKEWYCLKHAKEIHSIREELRETKKNRAKNESRSLLQHEIALRRQEIWLRKKTDAGHYFFLFKLVNKLLFN